MRLCTPRRLLFVSLLQTTGIRKTFAPAAAAAAATTGTATTTASKSHYWWNPIQYFSSTTVQESKEDMVDPIERVASKQSEWCTLPISEKIIIMKEILTILKGINLEKDVVASYGKAEVELFGFDFNSDEGINEAYTSSVFYLMLVQSTVQRFIHAYTCFTGETKQPMLDVSEKFGRKVIKTLPVMSTDKMGPFAKSIGEVWLKEDASAEPFKADILPQDKEGCMVVLSAGNHCFLGAVDVLNGLFDRNHVIYLKHHPIRPHHDPLIRKVFQPLIERGYLDTEIVDNVERAKEIVYHPSVSKVHLTGGKATHDAIVWGGNQRTKKVLKAEMTSELGCVTPWIIANQKWTEKELQHQIKHLYNALYSNAGANCNSPKVVVMINDWEHKEEFIDGLLRELSNNDLPSAYYPGMKDRWNKYREVYPNAKEFGDNSSDAIKRRQMKDTALLLPWLVIDNIHIDLSTDEGRKTAKDEYALHNEPFAPVITFVTVNSLNDAVTLCNDYMFGSLSCSLIAPDTKATDVQDAISKLKYGGIAINAYSGYNYAATGLPWGAYPNEQLDNVESGTGRIDNVFFIPNIEKGVLITPMVDQLHSVRNPDLKAATKELKALGYVVLKPSLYSILNLVTVSLFGIEMPFMS